MKTNQIDLKKTGLLFFDMLVGFCYEDGRTAKKELRPMIRNAARLLQAARAAGLPIFFAKGNHRSDGGTTALLITDTDMNLKPWPKGVVRKGHHPSVAGEAGAEVIPELAPRPEDYLIPKYRRSAFFQTYFDLALRTRGVDTVIVSGYKTDEGVLATMVGGRDLDYNMIIVRDACATKLRRVQDTFMEMIYPKIARVRTTDQMLRMLREAARRDGG
jgi:nicotinamidase-related amidase